jgi:two-component system, sensor histidine kinase and response regulator
MKSSVNKQTILIIDDHRMMLNLMGSILEDNNYTVFSALYATDAIKILNTTEIDLILLDIVMPDIDGFQLCRKIKSTASWKNIPVIFVSALSESSDIVKGLEFGVDYISKPFTRDEFLARINKHMIIKKTMEQMELQIDDLRKTNRYLLGTMHEMAKVMEDTRVLN